jgi:hypothetical protein
MNSKTTEDFWKSYDKLPITIQDLAKKSFGLFKENHSHPSLQFKKINDNPEVYSVRISLNYRALAAKQKDTLIWFWIGNHTAYEKLIQSL